MNDSSHCTTCAIVLAAGQSRRMGRNKLLLPLGGKPMIALIVDELLRSPVDRIFVVVGPESSSVRQVLDDRPVHYVTNCDPNGEMLISVRCGLRALPVESESVLVCLGDQPGIKAEVVARLMEMFRKTGQGIIVPSWQGRRGHPLLIAKRYWEEILSAHWGNGLRGLLQAHSNDIIEMPVDTPDVMEDMDIPEDYERLSRDFRTGK